MRRDDQPVDLLVAVIGEREHRPIRSGFARAHFDAADNAVIARRGGNLDAVAVGVLDLDRVGQIDGRGIGADIDGFDGLSRRHAEQRYEGERQQGACHSTRRRGKRNLRGDLGGNFDVRRSGARSSVAGRVGAQIGGAQKCQETPPRPAVGAICATMIDPRNKYLPGFAPNSRRLHLNPATAARATGRS